MPTFLTQFADAEIKLRHKEPFLTAGVNEAFTGIIPKGVHRGFKLVAHPSLAGTLIVEADAADSDHVAAYTTADGYTIRIRRDGGDFNLALNDLAFANMTLVIAIFTEYMNATTTSSVIRAYELDPTDEFTGAGERGELVVLGQVVMPNDPTADLIVANNVTPTFRTLAWEEVGSDAMPWEQVVENGNFELAADGAFVAADRGHVPHWDTQYLPVQHSWEIETTNPHTGQYCLKVTGTGTAPPLGSVIPTDRLIAVQPGQLLRVSFWVRGENWPVIGLAGTMGFQLNFYGANLSLLAFRVAQDKTLNGTFAWTRVDEYIEVPAAPSGIAWCVPSIVVLDQPTPATVGQSLVFDDVRVWVANGPPTIPFASVKDGLTNGGPVVSQLGIAETNVFQFGLTQTLETFVKGILSLHKFDNVSPGVNRYRWKRLDDEPFALRLVEGGLRFEGTLDDAIEAAVPRVTTEIANAPLIPYVLLWEVQNPMSGESMRIYATSSTAMKSTDALCVVMNARWDGTSQVWYRDAAFDSSRIDIYKGGIAFYHRNSTDADGWIDTNWDNPDINRWADLRESGASSPVRAVLDLEADLELNGLIEDLGSRYISDPADAEEPRIESRQMSDAVHVRPFTLLWEVNSVDSIGWVRLYATGGFSGGLEEGLVVTVNARWDHSANSNQGGWFRDVSASLQDSFRMIVQQGAFLLHGYYQTDADGWLESAWTTTSGFGVISRPQERFSARGTHLNLRDGEIQFGDVSHMTNPLPYENPLTNTLYAKNVVKAWGVIRTDQGSPPDPELIDGFGIASVSYVGIDELDITLSDSMSPAQGGGSSIAYVVLASVASSVATWVTATAGAVDANSISVRGWRETAGTIVNIGDITSSVFDFYVLVIGEQ